MNLVKQRLEQLSRVADFVEDRIKEKVEREDLEDWGQRPPIEQKMTMSVLSVPSESIIRNVKGSLTP